MKMLRRSGTIQVNALRFKHGAVGFERICYSTAMKIGILSKLVCMPDPNPKIPKQRKIDKKHVKDIFKYTEVEPSFILGTITVDGDANRLDFETDEDLMDAYNDVVAGILYIPLDYMFDIADGQHRVKALIEAYNQNPQRFENCAISVNIIIENDVDKIQQDFVDMNSTPKNVSSSIMTWFDKRIKVSRFAVDLTKEVEIFQNRVEKFGTYPKKRSTDLFSLGHIRNAAAELLIGNSQLGKGHYEPKIQEMMIDDAVYEEKLEEAIRELRIVQEHLKPWSDVVNEYVVPEYSYRAEYLCFTGVGLYIICRTLFNIRNQDNVDKNALIERMCKLEWRKDADIWLGNIVQEGKVVSSRRTVELATTRVLEEIELPQQTDA